MSKIKRNDPCPCGSGKKYKQCHEPIDRAHDDHLRLLRRAMDRLIPKIIEQTQSEQVTPHMSRLLATYWNGTYSLDQLSELDDLEDHGAERFLTWVAFDAELDNGQTLVEQLATEQPTELELDEYELELLPTWTNTRLRPYVVEEVIKGKGAQVRDVVNDTTLFLRDHAAAKRLETGEVLFVHLVPVAEEYFIAGAAAQATPDALEKFEEYLALQQETWHVENPESAEDHVALHNTALLNHFVMALPREEHASQLDDLLMRGRIGLEMAKQRFRGTDDSDEIEFDEVDDDTNSDEDSEPHEAKKSAVELDMEDLWADEVDESSETDISKPNS